MMVVPALDAYPHDHLVKLNLQPSIIFPRPGIYVVRSQTAPVSALHGPVTSRHSVTVGVHPSASSLLTLCKQLAAWGWCSSTVTDSRNLTVVGPAPSSCRNGPQSLPCYWSWLLLWIQSPPCRIWTLVLQPRVHTITFQEIYNSSLILLWLRSDVQLCAFRVCQWLFPPLSAANCTTTSL